MTVLEAGFQALAGVFGLSIDQTRYIALLFCCYPVALVFRHILHPTHTSVTIRHVFSATVGITMGFMCYGWEMMWVFFMVGISYALLWVCPATVVQWITMVWAVCSLSAANCYRLYLGRDRAWDFTAALMMLVQKVTLVAFALHDGLARQKSHLNSDQLKNKIDARPSPLEYLSYTFNFHSLLDRPSCTFRDYLCFMDGSNFRPNGKHSVSEPSALFPVLTKLALFFIALVVFNIISSVDDPIESVEYSPAVRLLVTCLFSLKFRCMLYVDWMLEDSVSNAAGLGFNGYDEKGQAKWDLVTKVKLWNIEFALTPVSVSREWNVPTALWLRRCCYERMKFSPLVNTLGTFFLSALWHGFYPGYYLCLLFCGIAVVASRKLRRLVRPHFVKDPVLKRVYDLITLVATQICMGFSGASFLYLSLYKGLLVWSHFYYLPLIIACAVAFLLPSGERENKVKNTTLDEQNPNAGDVLRETQTSFQSKKTS